MLSLGLDPSMTGFGWCVHDTDAVGRARVVKKGRWKTSSKDIFLCRYLYLRDSIGALLDEIPEIQIVGVESPPFGEQWSEGLYGLFLYVNEAVYLRRRDVVYFDPLTVKLLAKEDPALRRGKMFKADMVAMAKADTGIARWNADEADAYHIARFSARFLLLLDGLIDEDVLLPSEKHVFLRQRVISAGGKTTIIRSKVSKIEGKTQGLGTMFRENDRFFRFSKLGAT